MAVYLLINIAFLYVLPIDVMAKSPLVAATAEYILRRKWRFNNFNCCDSFNIRCIEWQHSYNCESSVCNGKGMILFTSWKSSS